MVDVARLTIKLDDVAPRVIRCVEVPLSIRLDDLHFVLQIAIGWKNGHSFEFRIGDTAWGPIDRDTPDTNPLPAEQATLSELATLGRSIKYNYVFGEDWQHTIEIEEMSSVLTDGNNPKLLSAEGRCPPEDIGGPSGYELYLTAIADPNHSSHETMLEWDDPDFDPNTVNISNLRSNLENLSKYLGRRKPGQH